MRKQSYQEIEEKIIEKLHWQMGIRDDKKVAGYIHKNREMDGIYELKNNGILDGFYEWLEEIGIINMLKEIIPSGVERVMVPFFSIYTSLFFKSVIWNRKYMQSSKTSFF